MDYGGTHTLSPLHGAIPSLSSTTSKHKGNWRLGAKRGSTSDSRAKMDMAEMTTSPTKQRRGFKLNFSKVVLQKKKTGKRDEEQTQSDKGSSTTPLDDSGVVGGLPAWENPIMESSLSFVSPRRMAVNSNPAIHTKASRKSTTSLLRSKTLTSPAQPEPPTTLSAESSLRDSIIIDLDSSGSSLSLEDVACITLDESSSCLKKSDPLLSKDHTQATENGKIKKINDAKSGRGNKSMSSMHDEESDYSTFACQQSTSRQRRFPRSSWYKPPSPTPFAETPCSSPRRRQLNQMNASMDLGDVFGLAYGSSNHDSVDQTLACQASISPTIHKNSTSDDELEFRENEMIRMAMEASMAEFSSRPDTTEYVISPTRKPSRYISSVPSAPLSPLKRPPRSTDYRNQSMELCDVFHWNEGNSGDDDIDAGVDIEVNEQKLLDLALHMSVQDTTPGLPSNQSRPKCYERVTRPGTRHISMKETEIFVVSPDQPSEPLGISLEEEILLKEKLQAYHGSNQMIQKNRSRKVGYESPMNVCQTSCKDPLLNENLHSYHAGHHVRNGNAPAHAREADDLSRNLNPDPPISYDYQYPHGANLSEEERERLLILEEEEMIRVAMELSMQDAAPSHNTNAPLPIRGPGHPNVVGDSPHLPYSRHENIQDTSRNSRPPQRSNVFSPPLRSQSESVGVRMRTQRSGRQANPLQGNEASHITRNGEQSLAREYAENASSVSRPNNFY